MAVRQNGAMAPPASAAVPAPDPARPAVSETEGIVSPGEGASSVPAKPEDGSAATPELPESAPPVKASPPSAPRRVFPPARPTPNAAPVRVATEPAVTAAVSRRQQEITPAGHEAPSAAAVEPPAAPAGLPAIPERAAPIEELPEPARAAAPLFEEIVIPAASVIGLEIETTVTSERARPEDRVVARVTRDVFADGRLAIPAGSRVVGAVTTVERGGKVKERARLGIRFHTLVLGNGLQVPLRTETIYREGASPSNESSRKIGGAAIGGAVLGAILGGGKGAIAGATAGAAGGTAAVMAGGRNPATLTSGSIVTVKLAAPASFDIER